MTETLPYGVYLPSSSNSAMIVQKNSKVGEYTIVVFGVNILGRDFTYFKLKIVDSCSNSELELLENVPN